MNNRCIACGGELFSEPLIVCENCPKSAQKFPETENATDDAPVTLSLKQCRGCGLVQFDIPPVYYYRDVIRSGGYSKTMHDLRHEQYARFLENCPVKGKKVIEVGCGQGEFLRVWREDGFDVKAYGIENDPALVDLARKDGLKVEQNFAENENTVLNGAPFDAFCSFNFLEHQPDPGGMLRCIYNNLANEAYGLITVPAFEYILEKESYYELIRDHIAYYDKESFRFVLESNGFRVLSLRIVNRDTWEAIVEKKRPFDTEKLKSNKENLKKEIEELTSRLLAENKRLAVWGASHQGLTVLSTTALGDRVEYVIDSAPFKQGKYTIGSGVRIVSPENIKEEPVEAILIIAPGYKDEIAGLIKKINAEISIYTLHGNHIEKCE